MEHKKPLVSYILCIHNGEKTLKETFESLLSQRGVDLEIMAVDDGSIDKSLELVKIFSRKYKSIKIIQQPHLGLAIARNVGISMAKGDFIASASQDDIYLPDKTINQINFMLKNNFDFSFTNVGIIDKSGKMIKHKDIDLYNRSLLPWPLVVFQVMLFMPLSSPTFICRRKCYKQIKWNSGMLVFADKNLWLKMFISFRGGKLNKVSLLKRYHFTWETQEYKKKYPVSYLYLEHRASVASAFLYKIVPSAIIPRMNPFFKLLKQFIYLERNFLDKKSIGEIAGVYKKLKYNYLTKRFMDIEKNIKGTVLF